MLTSATTTNASAATAGSTAVTSTVLSFDEFNKLVTRRIKDEYTNVYSLVKNAIFQAFANLQKIHTEGAEPFEWLGFEFNSLSTELPLDDEKIHTLVPGVSINTVRDAIDGVANQIKERGFDVERRHGHSYIVRLFKAD